MRYRKRPTPDQCEDFRGSFVKQHDGTRTRFTPPDNLAARAAKEMGKWVKTLSPRQRRLLDQVKPLRVDFFDQYRGRPKLKGKPKR